MAELCAQAPQTSHATHGFLDHVSLPIDTWQETPGVAWLVFEGCATSVSVSAQISAAFQQLISLASLGLYG